MKRASLVVGVLLAITVCGLCVLGVQTTNMAALRTQCTNNLKQIGLGLHAHHDVHKRFPRAIYLAPTEERPPEQQLSWLSQIIPYVDAHMDPKWIVDETKPWNHAKNQYVAQKSLLVFLCPANSKQNDDDGGFTHYVGITGVGKKAAWLPLEHPSAGVFGYERLTTMSDLQRGASNVMMLAETATDIGHWVRGGNDTARGFDLNGTRYLGEHGQFNSFHGTSQWFGGVAFTTNVLIGDGTVRGLNKSTSDRLLESLATLAGTD